MLLTSAASPFASFLLVAFNARIAWAHGGNGGGNVLNELPDCWDSCSKDASGTDCSWYETSCICKLANDSDYLADTISCAKKTCHDFSSNQVDRFLSPIEFSCSLVSGIEQSRLNAAQAAAEAPASSKTTQKQSTTKQASTQQTTLRATTTNSKGSTAVVDQPLQYGPSGVSSGEKTTSVIESTVNIVPVPASSASSASDATSTTTANGIAVAVGTPTPSGGGSSTAGPKSTSQAGGGGTLFDSQGRASGLASSRSCALVVIAGVASFVFALAL